MLRFIEFSPGPRLPAIGTLPIELLLPLLADLPLISIFALSSTCRSLRRLITNTHFLDQALKECITRGSLHWLSPVERMPGGEVTRAHRTMRLWRPSGDPDKVSTERDTTALSSTASPLAHPRFPRLAFVRACWASDSMMNRKRLWGLSRQFAALWRDYRSNGWQGDYMFFDSRKIEQYAEGERPEHWRVVPVTPKRRA